MMWSLRASSGRIPSFASLAAVLLSLPLGSLAASDSGSQDLGSVLEGIKDLSTYYGLLKVYPPHPVLATTMLTDMTSNIPTSSSNCQTMPASQ